MDTVSSAWLAPDSPRKVVKTALICSASASWMTMSCSFTVLPLFLTEFADQNHARDGVEGVEDPIAVDGHGLEVRDLPGPSVEHELHVLDGRDVGEIALVVLNDVRHLIKIVVVLPHVLFQIAKALDILLQSVPL